MSAEQPPSSNGPRRRRWLSNIRRLFGATPTDRSQVVEYLRNAGKKGLLDAEDLAMLEGVLEVSAAHVREIMIPRSQMVVVERDAEAHDILPIIIESGHSRFPVMGDDRDEVAGVLMAKDLLRYFAGDGRGVFDIREYMRAAVFIPESKRLKNLLKEFRSSHNHMAIVVDEYGAVAGLLTIEDVLEQIVGDIDDEHDIEEDIFIQRDSANQFTVHALTRIDDFNEYFGSKFSDEDYGTVGGLILSEMGKLPGRDETVTVDGYAFKVTRAGRRRIDTLQVTVSGKDVPGALEEQ
ncbi:MAG: CBS domain-containing protein [Gammaproteobacteria bacterium]|nr:CBS domain-containing protein [Gammaproteobacteria bacterium]